MKIKDYVLNSCIACPNFIPNLKQGLRSWDMLFYLLGVNDQPRYLLVMFLM